MFRVQLEKADGTTLLGKTEYRLADTAEGEAERFYGYLAGTGGYSAVRVLEQDGTVYSEMEC
jgi:hypothetical protein